MARLKLSEKLLDLGEEIRGVYVPYPREMERVVNLYARGEVGWDRVVEEARRGMPEFYRGWLWVEEPLIRSLRVLGARVACYGDKLEGLYRSAGEFLSALLRVRVTGEVRLEEWRKLLSRSEVPVREGYVTVSSFSVPGATNVDVWGLPYPPTDEPDVGSEGWVRELVEYVFDYLVTSRNVDEAYVKWLRERRGVRARELEEMLSILPGD